MGLAGNLGNPAAASLHPDMSLYTLGLNHTTAPLEVRERVTFGPDVLGEALRDLTGGRRAKEAAILSTCNRTEVYFHGGEPGRSPNGWTASTACAPTTCAPTCTRCRTTRRSTHAFRVASGLDSMVLGEPQILGQLKQAVRDAESAGSLGLVLNRLFQRTFAVAKDVRTHTDIGSASISMAAASVKLAERIFPSIAEQKLLLIGAGEMIELAATHFAATAAEVHHRREPHDGARRGAGRPLLGRRDHARRGPRPARDFDIVVTCTASTLPILGKGLIERAIRERRHRPMFIVDLAVPRDVEPEARALDDIFLYSIDDLAAIVKDNLQIRREAVAQAEAMIAEQTEHFLHWLEGRDVVPTITALSGHHDALRVAELDRARKLLEKGTSPTRCSKPSRAGSPTSSCTRRSPPSTRRAKPSAPS